MADGGDTGNQRHEEIVAIWKIDDRITQNPLVR